VTLRLVDGRIRIRAQAKEAWLAQGDTDDGPPDEEAG
jgi:hypothetical protein